MRGPGIELTILSSEPELLTMEATYDGTGQMPPAHFHPSQAERFTILEGRMRTLIDGAERVYEEGQTFEVPPGTVHQMAAEGGPARTRWEVRPALRTADFFETLYSGNAGANFLDESAPEFRLALPSHQP